LGLINVIIGDCFTSSAILLKLKRISKKQGGTTTWKCGL